MPDALTLAGALAELARHHPDDVALVEVGGVTDPRVTFAELDALSAAYASALADHGVRRGDVVGVWLPNVVESVVLEFALARLGAATLGVNTRYGEHELTHLMETGRPVGLVAPADFHGIDFAGRLGTALDAMSSPAPRPRWIAWVGGDAGDVRDLPSWQLGVTPVGGTTPPLDEGRRHDAVNYFTTSGSTGLPKLAGHDQQSVVRHARNAARAFDMRSGDVSLGVLPLSGVFGFNHVMAMLLTGGATVLVPVLEPVATVEAMARWRVTHVIGGDDLFGRIRDGWERAGRPALTLRRGGIADFTGDAAGCVAWADESFGADVTGVYGSSEVFALTAAWPSGLPVTERVRGGGRLVSRDIEVRIVDPDSGVACERGETGEIQLRGYNVVTDYLGSPESARDSWTADGWFRTGDLGFREERDDEIVYVCRAGDALRLRGFLVEPAEIERFLMGQPGVDTVKVVAARAADGGDGVVAFATVTADDAGAAVDADGLLAVARSRLAAYKVPQAIRVVDELPVTSGTNGTKVRTSVLRQWADELVGSAGADGGSVR
jgi:fatty-acyl-CoA synthase